MSFSRAWPRWVFSGLIVVLIGVGISSRWLEPQRTWVALGVGSSHVVAPSVRVDGEIVTRVVVLRFHPFTVNP